MSVLSQIQQEVINKNYFISSHAEEEMQNDALEIEDIENAILKGIINKKLTHDIRGTRYCIEGPAIDQRIIEVICRYNEKRKVLIITVYALEI